MLFNPCKEYEKLKIISTERKIDILGENHLCFSYRQLQKIMAKRGTNFSLHHYVPRYRMKNEQASTRDSGENILLLTLEEHILAHYYLSIFETLEFKFSAFTSFIMIFNLTKDKKLLFTSEEKERLLQRADYCRSQYKELANSVESLRATYLKTGERMKTRFKTDPEFKKKVLNAIHTEDIKIKAKESRKKIFESTPPWRYFGSNTKTKYEDQRWDYFDTIYNCVVLHNLSYKTIARILNVEHKTISNIVRIIKENYMDNRKPFNEFIFKDDFLSKFKATYEEYTRIVDYYSNSNLPWSTNFNSALPWLKFDLFLYEYIYQKNTYSKINKSKLQKILGYRTGLFNNLLKEAESLYVKGVYKIEDCYWYREWLILKDIYTGRPNTCGSCIVVGNQINRKQCQVPMN